MVVSGMFGLFAGGWLASCLAGVTRDEDGTLHGLVTWGLSTLFVVLFLMAVFGSLLGSTVNGLGYGAAAVTPQVAQSGTWSSPVSWTLHLLGRRSPRCRNEEVHIRRRSPAPVPIASCAAATIASREALIDTVVARTKMSRAETAEAVEQAQ
jgi:hypothetical protein